MIIETPAVMLDMTKIKKNIKEFQEIADKSGFKLRPHTKTHKMPELAKLQLAEGAVGITCASVSEAQCMAEHGIDDIFIAYSVIGANKVERALDVAEKIRLIVGVDSKEGAVAFSEAARKRGVTLEVRLEIDTGMHRCGVDWREADEMALYISNLPHLKLEGIFTYKSAVYQEKPSADCLGAAKEESLHMAFAAQKIREKGLEITVSGGSTPTAGHTGAEPGLTEIRPGSYIFGDIQRVRSGAITTEQCALTVAATVISTPAKNRAVIDGGVKSFSGDVAPNQPPFYVMGYGNVVGHENVAFVRMSEEHGVLESVDGGSTGLRIGQIVRVIPNHCCTAQNLVDYVYIINEDGSLRRERVWGRGLSY